jgi:hypothetical protein
MHAETLQGVQESWKPLKVPEKVKLRRVSDFMHKAIDVRSVEDTKILEEFRVFEAQEEWNFVRAKETQGEQLAGKIIQSEGLRHLEFFQVLEESAEAQEGAQ